ncbi:MAG TPA: hypothetical protein VFU43_11880 [Streptosporangiaceae bacterium]|nr:hypothetical protein [Streptosporangiaceae bacterium]
MKRLTPITMATVAFGGLLLAAPTAAAAAETPTYTCQSVGEDGQGTVMGVQDCQASSGAVTTGTFTGTSVVRSSQYGFSFTCTGGGRADVPDTVTVDGCTSR